MSRNDSGARGAALLVGIAALLLWAGRAQASIRDRRPEIDVIDPGTGEVLYSTEEPESEYLPGTPAVPAWEPPTMPNPELAAYDDADLIASMLAVIRRAEVGGFDDAIRYRTFYGGARFAGMLDHPVITGEMKGKRLPDWMCRNVGLRPGCVSTAAGAYQIIAPTWRRLREAGRWGPRLPDFSPASQDEAARRLLGEVRALEALQAGDVETAIRRAGTQWASLPGSTSGQPQKPIGTVIDWFLGELATRAA